MKRKWIIFLVLTILVLVIIGYNYIYKEHRDIESEAVEFVLTSDDLSKEFSMNSFNAEKKYADKTIEISGVVTEVNKADITLGNSVFSQFDNTIVRVINIDDNITIKGRFIGYDDLLEQVRLDQCSLID